MPLKPRLVIVPDTDPGIKYVGPWFKAPSIDSGIGNYGPPVLGSLHGVSTNASLSYTFSGTSVAVYGTLKPALNDINSYPQWACLIDGTAAPANLAKYTTNNWILCEIDQLSDGSHNISLQAILQDQMTFYFNHVQYVPSVTVPLDQAIVVVEASDPAMQYSPGWEDMDDNGNMTGQNLANITLEFIGVSLLWTAAIPTNQPRTAGTATYSIDGGPTISFTVPALGTNEGEQYNQILFKTDQLSSRKHRIEVVNQGDGTKAPLTLEHVVISNNTLAFTGVNTSTTKSPTSTGDINSGNTSSRHTTLAGPIVGGVLGALILTLVVAFLLRYHGRRTKKDYRPYPYIRGKSTSPGIDDVEYSRNVWQTDTTAPKAIPTGSQSNLTSSQNKSNLRGIPIPILESNNTPFIVSNEGQSNLRSDNGMIRMTSNGKYHLVPPAQDALVPQIIGGESRPIMRSANTTTRGVIRHEDSGLRMTSNEGEESSQVLELPPFYTEG